jgi:hypothetical protein
MLENTKGAIKKGQSRETGNIRYTGQINVREYQRGNQKRTIHRNWQHRGTQDTGQINVREYQRGNQKRTIHRNWQHKVHRTNKR